MPTKRELMDRGLKLIPVSEIEITKDKDKTTGYDFTVEDYYTFATHDGVYVQDCMALYMPVTERSNTEIKTKLGIWNNLLSQTDLSIVPRPNQDIILGVYSLTSDKQREIDETKKMKDGTVGHFVEFKGVKLTIHRYLFNKCLPESYPVIDRELNKSRLNDILNDIVLKYNYRETMDTLDKIKDIAFTISTIHGYTLSIEDLYSPELNEIRDNELTGDMVSDFKVLKSGKVNELVQGLGFTDMIKSGARGSWEQVNQLVLSRGYVSNYKGVIVPNLIRNNLVSGLTQDEFFDSCWGARKGLLDTALSTGKSGHLTRKLMYSTVFVELDDGESGKDCGTDDTVELYVHDEKMAKTMVWRNVKTEDGYRKVSTRKGVDTADLIGFDKLVGSHVHLRSPIYCTNKKICKKCYGELYKILHSNQLGIIATQSIGERLTQLVLRTFHTGGVAEVSDRVSRGHQDDIISGMSIADKLLHKPSELKRIGAETEEEKIESPEQFLEVIYSIFGIYGGMHMVHYEIIISAMMWSGKKLWRIHPDRNETDFKFESVYTIPQKVNWLLACALSNLKDRMISGVIDEADYSDTTISNLFKY